MERNMSRYVEQGMEDAANDEWSPPWFDEEAKIAYVKGHGFSSGQGAYNSGGYREPNYPRFLETEMQTIWREAYNAGYDSAAENG
jgi:hypothetical protein